MKNIGTNNKSSTVYNKKSSKSKAVQEQVYMNKVEEMYGDKKLTDRNMMNENKSLNMKSRSYIRC
jgi:hypothetical protein